MELFELYEQFIGVRKELEITAIENAVYAEKRDDVQVRPLAVIKKESDLLKVNKLIAEWRYLVDVLCTGDPTRYKRNSVTFSPCPVVLHNQTNIFIKVNTATSTRKLTKENIIKRLRDLKRVSYLSHGNNDKTQRYAKEIEFFEKDHENTYRVRSDGYTEIIIMHKAKGDKELSKSRVPYIGTFVYDPNNECSIELPQTNRDYARSDKLSAMNIPIIPCSLSIRGLLFRETDIINAKAKSDAEKKRAIEEKNRKAKEKKESAEKLGKIRKAKVEKLLEHSKREMENKKLSAGEKE